MLLECVEAGVQQEVHGVTGERESVANGLPVDIAVVDTFEYEDANAEIQARINVENARLQNEQIKLSTIAKMEESERQLKTERVYNGFSAGMANFSRPNF